MTRIFKQLFIIGILSLPIFLGAQTFDIDKIVTPEDAQAANFEEYLVQLAWNNSPENKGIIAGLELYELEKQLARKAWMNDLSASFNLNNISLSQLIYKDQIDIPVFFPIYNLQAGFNLGTLLTTKHRVKTAEVRRQIAEFDLDQKKLGTRRAVLEAYAQIIAAEEVMEIRKLAVKDTKASFVLISEKFRLSEVDFEDLNQASGSYYASQESVALAEADTKASIIRLEEYIGIPYKEALKYKKRLDEREKRRSRK